MNQRDRVKLLFGPYKLPLLKKGDRATCLVRDCTVLITSSSDARIPWPRCRSLGTPQGGSGILVDEELARAIRHESAAALMHWWGVTAGVVWRWRKALGIGRARTEGSQRLIQDAATKGAAGVKAREYTPKERKAQSWRNRKLNLKRFLHLGNHGPLWTAEQVALLGTMPDDDLAAQLGKSINSVRLKHEKLGIPKPSKLHWTPEQVAMLGTLPDWVIAARTGRTLSAVTQKRIALQIPNPHDRRFRGHTR
jgi:hypothetical protein